MKKKLCFALCLSLLCACSFSDEASIQKSTVYYYSESENGSGSSAQSSLDSSEVQNNLLISGQVKNNFTEVAKNFQYDFDPTAVVVEKHMNADGSELSYSDVKTLTNSIKSIDQKRTKQNGDDIHIVYYFEGDYFEGFSGDYVQSHGECSFWEDGLLLLTVGSKSYAGFWWNQGDEVEDGKPMVCLMTPNDSLRTFSLEETASEGQFYSLTFKAGFNLSWGTRTITMKGTYYSPTIGLIIDDIDLKSEVVACDLKYRFFNGKFPVYRVNKNLEFYQIYSGSSALKYNNIPDMKYPHSDVFSVSYSGFDAEYPVTIIPDEAEYTIKIPEEPDFTYYKSTYLSKIYVNRVGDWRRTLGFFHGSINTDTNEYSVGLPDGSTRKITIPFKESDEDNTIEGSFYGRTYSFTFKSLTQIVITSGNDQATVGIKITDTSSSETIKFEIVNRPNNAGSFLNYLPSKLRTTYSSSNGVTTWRVAQNS